MLVRLTFVAATLAAVLVNLEPAAGQPVSAKAQSAASLAPWRTPVPTYIRPGETVMITRAVNTGGVAWVATDVLPPRYRIYPTPGRVRIYRFVAGHWLQSGSVHTRQIASVPTGGQCAFPYVPDVYTCFGPAWLTRSGAPDFVTSWCCGVDGSPAVLSIIRLAGGVWQPVNFQPGSLASSAPVQGAPRLYEVEGGYVDRHLLVLGGDSCGCAWGLDSSTYFRFNGSAFTATDPPGPTPTCTTAALNTSGPFRSPEADFMLTNRSRFHLTRVACEDGWALGAGVHARMRRLVVFTQESRVVHSQMVPTNGWYRQAYGTWKQIRSYGFAIPPVLLKKLAAEIGKPHAWPFPLRHRKHGGRTGRIRRNGGAGPPPVRWRHLPLYRYDLLPGAGFASAVSRSRDGEWFAVASGQIAPSRTAGATVTVTLVRWRRHSWSPPALVSIRLPAPFSRTPVGTVAVRWTRRGPVVSIQGSAGIVDFIRSRFQWRARVDQVHGSWRLGCLRFGRSGRC